MQNRDYKTFREGEYYHIYNRGNQKQKIFLDEADYKNFLKRCLITLNLVPSDSHNLRIQPLALNSLSVICYCLMPNHFHFVIRQNSNIGINRFISKVCTSYASYFNKKYNQVGHLFQDTFKAKLIDSDEYISYLSAYIHNNPDRPESYPYSSFNEIINPKNESICKNSDILEWFNHNPQHYKKFVLDNKKQSPLIEHLLFEEN